MERIKNNVIALVVTIVIITGLIFTLQPQEPFIYSCILPAFIFNGLQKRHENRTERKEEKKVELEDSSEIEKEKNLEYRKRFLRYFKRFLIGFIILLGITIALYVIDYDIHDEIGLIGYNISFLSILTFL